MSDTVTDLCLVGWGAIATTISAMLTARRSAVRVAALAVRDPASLRTPPPPGARILTDPEDVASSGCTLVVEAAGRDAAAQWGAAALGAGLDFVMGSPSALADPATAEALQARRIAGGGRLILPAGSLGGIGALASAARMPLASVTHEIAKPPLAWVGTLAERVVDLFTLTEPRVFFDGSARDAARLYPSNANSVVVTALAGIGLDRTTVRLVADPGLGVNEHRLAAQGDFGHWTMTLANAPLAHNPKSSAMTALALVRLIENRGAGVVV